MLKVASFKFNEADKINNLLSKYRLASGAHIMVSNGELVVPYEDGEEATKEQKIIAIKEQKNTMLQQAEIITHSNHVLSFLIKDGNTKLADLEEKIAGMKGAGSEKDSLKKEASEYRNQLSQMETQKRQNEHELARLAVNCEIFDETIAELSA